MANPAEKEGTNVAREQTDMLQSLVNRLRQVRREAGDRVGEVLAETTVRERVTAVGDRIEDLRVELAKRRRSLGMPSRPAPRTAGRTRGTSSRTPSAKTAAAAAGKTARTAASKTTRAAASKATRPARQAADRMMQDMTVRELHELATRRHIPGRSAMNKAELVDALRKS